MVHDPLIGSGTTAVAAVRAKRHYVGYEVSLEYCEAAKVRVGIVPIQGSIDGSTRGPN